MKTFFQFLIVPRVGMWRCLRFVGVLLLVVVLTLPALAFLMTWALPLLSDLPTWSSYLAAGVFGAVALLGLLSHIGGILLLAWHMTYGIFYAWAYETQRSWKTAQSHEDHPAGAPQRRMPGPSQKGIENE